MTVVTGVLQRGQDGFSSSHWRRQCGWYEAWAQGFALAGAMRASKQMTQSSRGRGRPAVEAMVSREWARSGVEAMAFDACGCGAGGRYLGSRLGAIEGTEMAIKPRGPGVGPGSLPPSRRW